MNKVLLYGCVIFMVNSCKSPHTDSAVVKSYNNTLNLRNEKIQTYKGDSIRRAYLLLFNLPEIKMLDHEAYMFYWGRIWHPSFLYFIEDSRNEVILKTRCFKESNGVDTITVIYKNKPIKVCRPLTVIDSSTQVISKEDWRKFKTLLEGSYYWLYDESGDDNRHIEDGESWSLDSKSIFGQNESLVYHSVSIRAPYEGSFKRACSFLIEHSDLSRNNVLEK